MTKEEAVERIIEVFDRGRIEYEGGYPSEWVIIDGVVYWATLSDYIRPSLVNMLVDEFIETYEYVQYWIDHPSCEASFSEQSAPPHHINTRGAHGTIDEAWNLLALSDVRHTEYHAIGHKRFAERYPHLAAKIRAAREKVGKAL